jgi:hypothetical protein
LPVDKHYIFICGHASHDKCCSVLGPSIPQYLLLAQSNKLVKSLLFESNIYNKLETCCVRLTTTASRYFIWDLEMMHIAKVVISKFCICAQGDLSFML